MHANAPLGVELVPYAWLSWQYFLQAACQSSHATRVPVRSRQWALLPIPRRVERVLNRAMARYHARVNSPRLGAALLLGLLLALGAGADEVLKTYQDPSFDSTVAKILVVGVHEDFGVRGQFENTVARALRAAGTAGEASLYSLSSAGELTAESLVAAAGKAGADAVMVTRVVDVQTEHPDATASFTEYFQAYSKYADPMPMTTAYTVRVHTDLYLVANQTRVWAVESTAFEKQNLFGVIDGIAKALTAQLRKDGLIE